MSCVLEAFSAQADVVRGLGGVFADAGFGTGGGVMQADRRLTFSGRLLISRLSENLC